MEVINSRKNPKILHLMSLRLAKNIKKENLFVDEGLKNLLMALRNHMVKEIYTVKPFSLDDDQIKVYQISQEVYEKVSCLVNGDGFIFICQCFLSNQNLSDKVVYLDDVQNPGNVGTIIRSCLAFNIDMVILSTKCASIYNFKTLSACKGSQYQIKIMVEDFKNIVNQRKENQFIISTCLSSDSIYLEDLFKLNKYIVVFGNEGKGISKDIIEKSDFKVKIPISNIDSLNVSVAAGIVLYHLEN